MSLINRLLAHAEEGRHVSGRHQLDPAVAEQRIRYPVEPERWRTSSAGASARFRGQNPSTTPA